MKKRAFAFALLIATSAFILFLLQNGARLTVDPASITILKEPAIRQVPGLKITALETGDAEAPAVFIFAGGSTMAKRKIAHMTLRI